jgi:GAF domain-containing protein
LQRTRELLAVDTATILLVDEAGQDLVATATIGLEQEVRTGVRIPIGEGFAGRIAAKAQPVTIDHVDHDTVINQILIDKHLRSMAGVPMLAPAGSSVCSTSEASDRVSSPTTTSTCCARSQTGRVLPRRPACPNWTDPRHSHCSEACYPRGHRR